MPLGSNSLLCSSGAIFLHFVERFLNWFEETENYKCVVKMFSIQEYLLANEEIKHIWFQCYQNHSIHDIIGRGFCHCLYHSNPSIYIFKNWMDPILIPSPSPSKSTKMHQAMLQDVMHIRNKHCFQKWIGDRRAPSFSPSFHCFLPFLLHFHVQVYINQKWAIWVCNQFYCDIN